MVIIGEAADGEAAIELAFRCAPHVIIMDVKMPRISGVEATRRIKRFLPGVLCGEFENSEVELVAWQGSGDIAATARANCYVVIPPDRECMAAGEWVAVMLR